MSWILEAIVGILMGVLAHALLRETRGGAIWGTFLFGIIGAVAASKLVAYGPDPLGVHWLSALIGGLLLALLWELLFIGSRRSNIISGS